MIDFTFKLSEEQKEQAEKVCREEYNISLEEATSYFVERLVGYGGFPFGNKYDTEGTRMRIKTTEPTIRAFLKEEFAALKIPCATDNSDTLVFIWGNPYELLIPITRHREKEWYGAFLDSLTECILICEGYQREDVLRQARERIKA